LEVHVRKLDPTLQSFLRRHQSAVWSAAPQELSEDDLRLPPERVDLAVMFEGEIADLQAVGFEPRTVKKHPTQGYAIATGTIAVARLGELEQLPHLVTAEASRPMWTDLNSSVSEIRADELHEAATPLKGAGVVVGVIDSGFDIHHQNFRKADGTTRILALWDQTIDPGDAAAQPGERHPDGYAFGVEYDEARINDALTTDGRLVRTNDLHDDGEVNGHGTHVLGIAAGDGSQAGNCRGTFTFVGVAPEAEIILVRLESDVGGFEVGESRNLVDAFEWIWRHNRTAEKPIVVNLSQGDNMGAHDGTSLVELSIDIEVLVVEGHIAVKSAGNAGDDMQHAEATVAPGDTVEVRFTVRDRDSRNRHIDIWYEGADRLDVQLVAPGAGPPTSPTFSPQGGDPPWVVNPGAAANRRTQVEVTSELNHPVNSNNRIHILIDPASKARIPAGPWRLRLTNTGATPAPFDAWIDRGKYKKQPTPPHHTAPFFTSHVTTAKTVNIPGTSDEVITVGNYAQDGGLFSNWTGDVQDSSGRGPTRDGRTKPDLSAPGVAIKSAAAEETDNCCCDCCEHFYLEKDGTSQSAPHVAGVVALMLQKNPELSAADAKQILMNTARAHGGGSPGAPDNTIGAGKVNAKAAVDNTPVPGGGAVGGGGGGGGGGAMLQPIDADRIRRWFESPTGQLWAALVSRHLSEVRGLINNNRRVATFWHRLQGPRLLRAARLLASTGDPVLLAQIDAAEVDRRATQFLHVLEKYGSPRLRHDLQRHGGALLALGWNGIVGLVTDAPDKVA
jgi:subtilisin family serine protease